jgi:hypothetical protein
MRGLEEWVGVRRERSEKVGDLGPVEGFHKLGKMDYVSALSFLHYTGNQRDGETWSRPTKQITKTQTSRHSISCLSSQKRMEPNASTLTTSILTLTR